MDSSDRRELSGPVGDQLLAIASDVFGVAVAHLSMTTSPGDIESWDSVQHIILMMAVEQYFAVTFTPSEIEHVACLGDIAAALGRRAGSRSTGPSPDH